MIQALCWVFMAIAAGNIWGGWGVVLVMTWMIDRIIDDIK